jgi:hypothetical protein
MFTIRQGRLDARVTASSAPVASSHSPFNGAAFHELQGRHTLHKLSLGDTLFERFDIRLRSCPRYCPCELLTRARRLGCRLDPLFNLTALAQQQDESVTTA